MVLYRLRIQACVFLVALLGLKPSAIDGKCTKQEMLSGGKCLCMSGKVVLWLIIFTLEAWSQGRILNFGAIYTYICTSSASSCSSCRVRPVVAVVLLCPSVRPVVRLIVAVRPSSVRPPLPCRRLDPSSVRSSRRPVVRLIIIYMTSRSIRRMVNNNYCWNM